MCAIHENQVTDTRAADAVWARFEQTPRCEWIVMLETTPIPMAKFEMCAIRVMTIATSQGTRTDGRIDHRWAGMQRLNSQGTRTDGRIDRRWAGMQMLNNTHVIRRLHRRRSRRLVLPHPPRPRLILASRLSHTVR
jgi:hypothetical protein